MTTLEKQILKARPQLRVVSPWAYWITCVYAYFNIILGFSLFFTIDQGKIVAPLIIVNDILGYSFWGAVFVLVGVFKLFAIKTNNWDLSRKSLLVGVSIKAAWALALIVRAMSSPGTWFVALMWLALASIQIVTYIFFMPPEVATYRRRKP